MILILDNCSLHPFLTLSNVKLVFLPSNTTSRLQAMDMGVIHLLKSIYRSKLVRKLVALIDNNSKPDVKNVDLYEVLIMLKRSWNEVTEETIRNCFKKSGLSFHANESHEHEFEEGFDNTLWTELTQNMGLNDMQFNDFVNFDNELAVTDEISNGEDLDSSEMDVGIDSDETIIDENDSEESEEPLKLIDALNAMTQLRKYVTQCNGLENSHELINDLENSIYNNRFKNLKQTKITDFLK